MVFIKECVIVILRFLDLGICEQGGEMKIGEIVRSIRQKRSMSIEGLSMEINLSKSALSDIERYSRMPRFDDMCKICEVLSLDPKKVWRQIREDYFKAKKREEAPCK